MSATTSPSSGIHVLSAEIVGEVTPIAAEAVAALGGMADGVEPLAIAPVFRNRGGVAGGGVGSNRTTLVGLGVFGLKKMV